MKTSSSKGLYVIGAGGHSLSAIDLARELGYEIRAVIFSESRVDGLNNYRCLPFLPIHEMGAASNILLAIGDNNVRYHIYTLFTKLLPAARFPSLVHPTAAVSPSAKIGIGSLIFANTVIGSQSRVGRFVIVNNLASADHNSSLSDFASLAPGVVVGGNVSVGLRSAIGIGAKVKHKTSIGSDSLIGAMSFVNKDIPEQVVAWGIPAKTIRSRQLGDAYL